MNLEQLKLRILGPNRGPVEGRVKVGVTYDVLTIRNGVVIDRDVIHNIVPMEGLNSFLSTMFKGTTQVTSWYIGIFEGNYTPISGDTGATFPASSTESTAYVESTRQLFSSGTVAGGTLDNSATRAQFTMNANKTIYGMFMNSASAKGATTGVLLSAVKFSTAKTLTTGDVLAVTAGVTMTSS